jgi:plasmid stabilization system protein ParE
MFIRWTVEARSDLVRLYEFLAPVNRQAAVRLVRRLRATPARLLQRHPRLGSRLDDFELRYELLGDTILVANLWHTSEDR